MRAKPELGERTRELVSGRGLSPLSERCLDEQRQKSARMKELRAKLSDAREKAEAPDLTFAPNLTGAAAAPSAVPGSLPMAWPGSAKPSSFQTTRKINLAVEQADSDDQAARLLGSPDHHDKLAAVSQAWLPESAQKDTMPTSTTET